MAAVRAFHVVRGPSAPTVRLAPELLDLLCEAVLGQADEAGRSDAAARLVQEIYDCLTWLHPDPEQSERASFQLVVEEVEAHQARMREPPG